MLEQRRSGVLAAAMALLAAMCCQMLIQDVRASSYMPAHPQQKFCRAKYVFKFVPVAEMNETDRTKRSAGGAWYRSRPKTMMVDVEQFFKGKDMAMSMMELMPATENDTLDDVFSENRRVQAAIMPTDRKLEMNQAYYYFGRIMFRKMKKLGRKVIFANLGNTIPEAEVTKIMRRGFRKKYRQGCDKGCQVTTVFRKMDKDSDKKYCYFMVQPQSSDGLKLEDCRQTSQFCSRGKDGMCHWWNTKQYRKCKKRNILKRKEIDAKAQRLPDEP